MSEILQNLEDFFTEVGFLLSLQQTPVFVVTKTAGDPENKSSMGYGSLSHTDPENEPFSEKNHDTALSNLRP